LCAYRPLLKDHIVNTVGHTKLVPGLTQWLDLPDIAAMAIPARLHVINGRRDGLFTVDGMGVYSGLAQRLVVYPGRMGRSAHYRLVWMFGDIPLRLRHNPRS